MAQSECGHQDQNFGPLFEAVNGAKRHEKKDVVVSCQILDMVNPQKEIQAECCHAFNTFGNKNIVILP